MYDSGGAYGRNWEQNQGKTLTDFEKEPEVELEFYEGKAEYYVINVFHYLTKQLEVDGVCQEFNDIPPNDWDCKDYHGVSLEAGKLLDRYNVEILDSWNSYNGDSSLSQVIQGTYVRVADNAYIVLQIHGGCDIRGGYTNAKLFRIDNQYDYIPCLTPEDVWGTITPPDADIETPVLPGYENVKAEDVIQVSNNYDGCSFRDDNDKEVEIKETDNVSLGLSIW